MSVNDTSRSVIDNSRVVLQMQILMPLTDDSRGVIYDHHMFILQETDVRIHSVGIKSLRNQWPVL